MRRNLVRIVAVALIGTAVAGTAVAQQEEGITITASRAPKVEVVEPKPGSIMKTVSLSYGVSYSDLDLTTTEGKEQLKARVRQAAEDACNELDRQYPFSEPKGLRCVGATVDSAKGQVHDAIAAAGKPSKKL
jgi:UrcA family protein